MSMNIHSANTTTSYTPERNSTDSEQGQLKSIENVSQINSVRALTKAELTGVKVTTGDEQTVKNIERALKVIQGHDTSFEMSVHKATNTITIKVLNKDTGELIREIPPEKTLDLVAKFMEINGILIDEKI
ncbi:flagellar protein FlaG [Paenibacillus sepulcri]|uniref:Flagellar protein FlaG n=1 Tax=Paenibacillus sepulcri TaxID=359917 RepID=A0ABS7BV12_9BACL|nr:flagellar protein FlaG [Paenibacillus sepulcri]